MISGDKL